MAHLIPLIDISTLVTEIERRINTYKNISGEDRRTDALISLKNFISTLEMKEMNSDDVFIDKVCEWIMNHFSSEGFGSPLYYKGLLYKPEDIVEDFKKDMKQQE